MEKRIYIVVEEEHKVPPLPFCKICECDLKEKKRYFFATGYWMKVPDKKYGEIEVPHNAVVLFICQDCLIKLKNFFENLKIE